jgi:exodeoxyribonuclease-3
MCYKSEYAQSGSTGSPTDVTPYENETIMPNTIKLISWNVNGLSAVMKKGFPEIFASLDADIFAIQETRLQASRLTEDMDSMGNYQSYWSYSTRKKGYSGVGTYTRITPLEVHHGIGRPEYDDEGRILELDFGNFTFFNVYFPNGGDKKIDNLDAHLSGEDGKRLVYKLDFYRDFFQYANSLRADGKSLIIAGDYNIAHQEIDLKNPKANENYSGFLRIERDCLDRILQNGYVDTFRHLYPDTIRYTWWTYRFGARSRNVGWRIDYILVTSDMVEKGWIRDAFIDNDIMGSDHCPVGLVLEI